MNSPILITGCARSGTSVIAGIVNICGAFGGRLGKMYENTRIKILICEYLRILGADPLGQYPLPEYSDLNYYDFEQVKEIIIEDGYKDGAWMIKDTKIGLIWSIWNDTFPSAKWIIVRRRPKDIIESCTKTGFMSAFKKAKNQRAINVEGERDGWLWWIRQHEKRFVEMVEAGVNCKVIWPERLINGDYEQMKETIDWLRLEWNPACVDFVNKKLWKSKLE